ncbi:MAG: MFS transporter [Christensenellales bacterium]|jgi:fucose permease
MTNIQTAYRQTRVACYTAYFIQGVAMNLTAVLFVPLREQFGFSFSQLGLLVFINFLMQVASDVLFSRAVDKYGYRPFAVGAHMACFAGLVLFACTPVLFVGAEFVGFCISTAIFSAAIGILEVILSPIINALPSDHKGASMAVLHSFLAWGLLAVVVVSTLFLYLFGNMSWPIIVLIWAVIPFVNMLLYARVYLPPTVAEQHLMKVQKVVKNPVFILAFLAIFFGAAAEITLMQWISAFMEKGLGLSKVMGDLLGLCGFAFFFGVGRLVFSKYGKKLDVHKLMIYGSLITVFCYIIVAVSPYFVLSVAACCVAGAATCLLWPQTLVVASGALPAAGAVLFALLAAGGDIGTSICSWALGALADGFMALGVHTAFMTAEQFGLRAALLVCTLYPILSMLFQVLLKKAVKSHKRVLS